MPWGRKGVSQTDSIWSFRRWVPGLSARKNPYLGGESNGNGRTGTAKHNQWLDLSSSDLCSGASRIIDIFAEVKFETSFVFPVMICFGSRLAMVSFGRCRGGWLILCLLISQCCNYVLHPLAANKWTLMLQLQGCLAL